MTPPGDQLLAAIDATWPPARVIPAGPWLLREGLGGGQRVSAATAIGDVTDANIDTAVAGMSDLDQTPLFMIRAQDMALDASLQRRGFVVKDPVTAHIAPVSTLTGDLPMVSVTTSWPPLSVQREIWAYSGIGPARLAIMERARAPKASHLGRNGDVPAGTAYTAIDGELAMVHALEVLPDQKRMGVGKNIMTGAANWAASQGARWLAVLVVNTNEAANAFYQSLGMINSGLGYHYRRAPGGSS